MTPARLTECLTLIGWTGQELARQLRKDERQIRRWRSGVHAIPAPTAAWIEHVAAFHAANPAPQRQPKPQEPTA